MSFHYIFYEQDQKDCETSLDCYTERSPKVAAAFVNAVSTT